MNWTESRNQPIEVNQTWVFSELGTLDSKKVAKCWKKQARSVAVLFSLDFNHFLDVGFFELLRETRIEVNNPLNVVQFENSKSIVIIHFRNVDDFHFLLDDFTELL